MESAKRWLCLFIFGIGCSAGAPGQHQRALGANLLEDPSFEDGPPREIESRDGFPGTGRPWGGEEEGATIVVAGVARSGNQSARLQASAQANLYQRFATTPGTDYVASCWIQGDPALGLGGNAALSIRRTDVICPVDVCDDDGDEDLDHSDALIRVPLDVQSTDWTQISVSFNSGPLTQLAIFLYSEPSGDQFVRVDDCTVNEVGQGAVCGDQVCNGEENCHSCPEDCGACTSCGDGTCQSDEDCRSCPADCGSCPTSCGDGTCQSDETCGSCPADCGPCSSCSTKYGNREGFQVCFESATECGFEAVKNSVQSCDDVCADGGGRCLRALGNESSDPCTPTSEPADGCTRTDRYDDICVCSL